ncbi:MAG: hypothetical protein IJR46_06055 [Neisseriaceae bacterium]|nr:hypothetical protein [Neisseriaceae bacterium]
MSKSHKILEKMKNEPKNIRFEELLKICTKYFGEPRKSGTSHTVFKTAWQGDPRINIQNDKGMAKAYQVKQVLIAIEKLTNLQGNKNEH